MNLIKKFSNKVKRNPEVTMSVIAAILIAAIMCTQIPVLSAIITGRWRLVQLPNVPAANEPVVASWQQTFSVRNVKPGTLLVKDNLGSHSIFISVPTLDADLSGRMAGDNMSCIEVYFRRNTTGRLVPAYADEPFASAVFYFINQADTERNIKIAWENQGHDRPMCLGLRLLEPEDYIIKMTAACASSSRYDSVGYLHLSDEYGPRFDGYNMELTFTEISLAPATSY